MNARETVQTLLKTVEKSRAVCNVRPRQRAAVHLFHRVQPAHGGTFADRQGYLKPTMTHSPSIRFSSKSFFTTRNSRRLIGPRYLEGFETSDPNSEYIGRATMDIIERERPNQRWWQLAG